LAIRGERGVLVMSLDSLVRLSWNPFFPYLIERIEEGIADTPLGETGAVDTAQGVDNPSP
jgi:hypothetical protein